MLRRFDNYDLSRHNTFRMDVKCACYMEYDSSRDLDELDFNGLPQPVLCMGAGSNLLFTGDFPGTVLHSAIKYFSVGPSCEDSVQVEVGSGVVLDDFCSWACDNALWGVENLSGIPGEIGAAAVQNVGAYGVEIKDVVSCVKCYDISTRNTVVFRSSDCGYGYRDSIFKHAPAKGRYVVVAVLFQLGKSYGPRLGYGGLAGMFPADAELSPAQIREGVLSLRGSKLPDPAEMGSAGSFFKNPVVTPEVYGHVCDVAAGNGAGTVPHYPLEDGGVKIPAAWLIDSCGFRGMRVGGAAVYDRQALVIVNRDGKASPADVMELERRIVDGVRAMYGICLEPEVEHI